MNFNEHCDILTSKTISTLHSTGIFVFFVCIVVPPTKMSLIVFFCRKPVPNVFAFHFFASCNVAWQPSLLSHSANNSGPKPENQTQPRFRGHTQKLTMRPRRRREGKEERVNGPQKVRLVSFSIILLSKDSR